MIRLDKYLSALEISTRNGVRDLCKAGMIQVNGILVKHSDLKISWGSLLTVDLGYEKKEIIVKEHVTVLLHKPAGYVCSDVDDSHPSYRKLLADCPYLAMMHVAGRLDQDTTGLVIVTSDGEYNHRIISPRHKLPKLYKVWCCQTVSDSMMKALEEGVVLDDGYRTLPARVHIDRHMTDEEKQSGSCIVLEISEGKYHQVKRMLEAVGNAVRALHRIAVGQRTLDGLPEGKRRYVEPVF